MKCSCGCDKEVDYLNCRYGVNGGKIYKLGHAPQPFVKRDRTSEKKMLPLTKYAEVDKGK